LTVGAGRGGDAPLRVSAAIARGENGIRGKSSIGLVRAIFPDYMARDWGVE
jgi:hypothetical protein